MINKIFKLLCLVLLGLTCVSCASKNINNNSDSLSDQTPPTSATEQKAAADINTQLGFYYIQKGDYPRAQQKLEFALKQSPNDPSANSAMAFFLEKIGEKNEARKFYLNAIKLAPQDGAMYNNYGTFLCRNKQYNSAIEQFNLAVQNKDYLNAANACENAGLCAMQANNLKLAKEYFTKALQRNPNLSTSSYELSKIYYQEKQYKTANNYMKYSLQMTEPTIEALQLGIKINKKLDNNKMVALYNKQLAQLRQKALLNSENS